MKVSRGNFIGGDRIDYAREKRKVVWGFGMFLLLIKRWLQSSLGEFYKIQILLLLES